MLKLVKKIKKGKPADCTFDRTFENQKMGIEMLMCCNMNNRDYVTGPEVGLDANIIVHRGKPHYLFNPHLGEDGIFRHSDYLGNETIINNPPEYLLEAVRRLDADQS
jgi:hypothetical protein